MTPDLLAGGLFLLAGIGVLVVAGDYHAGDASRMGPGYFPRLLGSLLSLLGMIVLATGWRSSDRLETRILWAGLAVPAFWLVLAGYGRVGLTGLDLALAILLVLAWLTARALFWVLAGVALFALALDALGLVLASLALIWTVRRADPELGWGASLLLWGVLLIASLGVFVWGLGTPMPVWPRFVTG